MPRIKLRAPSPRVLRAPASEVQRYTPSEKILAGLSPGGQYFRLKSAGKITKRTSYATVSSWRDALVGYPHGKAAELRKKGELGYGARGEILTPPKSVVTRRTRAGHLTERLRMPHYGTAATHTYFNIMGDTAQNPFVGEGLANIQDWQKAYEHAVETDDGSRLLRFKYLKVFTADGVRVYPEYRWGRIKKYQKRMNNQQLAQFETDRNYRARDLINRIRVERGELHVSRSGPRTGRGH